MNFGVQRWLSRFFRSPKIPRLKKFIFLQSTQDDDGGDDNDDDNDEEGNSDEVALQQQLKFYNFLKKLLLRGLKVWDVAMIFARKRISTKLPRQALCQRARWVMLENTHIHARDHLNTLNAYTLVWQCNLADD